MIGSTDLLPLMTILPLIVALVTFAAGSFGRKVGFVCTLVVSACTSVISIFLLYRAVCGSEVLSTVIGGWDKSLGIELMLTPLDAIVLFLIHLSYFYTCIFSIKNWRENDIGYFYALLAIFVAGITGMTLSNDAFNIFVFMEVAAISAYSMVAMGNEKGAPIAAFDYLIMGSIGASLYLLGVGVLYLDTAMLNLSMLRLAPKHHDPELLARILIISGLAIKTAVFPLHNWLVNSYRFAPTPFSMFSSSVATKVFALVIFKTYLQIFGLSNLILYCGMSSMVFGAWRAFASKDMRNLIANSSVSQVGYILTGFALKSGYAMEAAVVNIVSHAVVQLAAFSAIGMSTLSSDNSITCISLRSRLAIVGMAVVFASIVGVPGTAGFLSKWLLLQAAIAAKQWLLVMAIAISSALAVGYCAHAASKMLTAPPAEKWYGEPFIVLGAVIIFLLGVYTAPLHYVSMAAYQFVYALR